MNLANRAKSAFRDEQSRRDAEWAIEVDTQTVQFVKVFGTNPLHISPSSYVNGEVKFLVGGMLLRFRRGFFDNHGYELERDCIDCSRRFWIGRIHNLVDLGRVLDATSSDSKLACCAVCAHRNWERDLENESDSGPELWRRKKSVTLRG